MTMVQFTPVYLPGMVHLYWGRVMSR